MMILSELTRGFLTRMMTIWTITVHHNKCNDM
jgi:hypothetical protein